MPFYYLVGEEAAPKAEFLANLRAKFGDDQFNVFEFQGHEEGIIAECMTLPVFSDKRLVVVRKVSDKQPFVDYLKDPVESTTLVLFCDDKKPDVKDPLVKLADKGGGLKVFAPLDDHEAHAKLVAEAKKLGKTLSSDAASVLVGEAGTDWAILSQELEKVCLFAGKEAAVEADDVMACLGYRKAANPWTFSNMIEARDLKGSIVQMRLQEGKPEDQARSALYKARDIVSRQLKARRLQRANVPPDQIGRAVRIYNAWAAGEFLKRMAKLSEARLRRDLKRCIQTETDLNSKTWLDPKVEVERMLVDLCRP